LKYANIGAKTLRSVLTADAKLAAMKREETVVRRSFWKDGKIGEAVFLGFNFVESVIIFVDDLVKKNIRVSIKEFASSRASLVRS
jgi:hypothetical protein